MIFNRKKLKTEENISSLLTKARKQKSLQLQDISKKLNINIKHLENLELGKFNNLPSGIYVKTFLKNYAVYLGLDEKKILEKFESENKIEKDEKNIFSKKKVKKHEFLVFPKIIRIVLIIIIVSALFVYLGFYLKLSLSAPTIEIMEPADNITTKNNFIYVIGKTSPKTEITINNKQILKDGVGIFKEKVDLKNGINTIIVTGKNKYSKKTIIRKQVLAK